MVLAAAAGGTRGLRPWSWLVLLVLWADPAPARPDLVFKVPEVTVRHAAAPRPVGTGPAAGARGNGSVSPAPLDPSSPQDSGSQDYYMEHEVTVEDAKKAAQALQLSQLPERYGCGVCARWEREYCSQAVAADHCCCEPRYAPEPFPWLPHACLMGRQRCRPRAHDCALYTRIRDCCCIADMADKWKSILSSARRRALSGAVLAAAALLALAL